MNFQLFLTSLGLLLALVSMRVRGYQECPDPCYPHQRSEQPHEARPPVGQICDGMTRRKDFQGLMFLDGTFPDQCCGYTGKGV